MSKLAWVIVIGIAVLVILMLVAGMLVPLLYGRGYGWGMMGGFGFPMMGMGLGMLVFWVLIIAGGVWLVQSLSRGTGSSLLMPQGESPLDILKRRYAKGEITKDQFDQMKRDLSQ